MLKIHSDIFIIRFQTQNVLIYKLQKRNNLAKMEALYHETNAILEQTQGYFIRLEQDIGETEFNQLRNEIQRRYEYLRFKYKRLSVLK